MDDFVAPGAELLGAEPDVSRADAIFAPVLDRRPVARGYAGELTDLLRPEYCMFPLIGRSQELQALLAWLEEEAPFVRAVVGSGGSGKTRLAIEFCVRAEALGWEAGFIGTPVTRALSGDQRRRLVVVDGMSEDIAASAIRAAGPASRVLLLMQDADACARLGVTGPVLLGGVRSVEDRAALLNRVVRAACSRSRSPARNVPACLLLDSAEPLHLVMAGLLAPVIGIEASLALPVSALAADIAQIEAERLDKGAMRAGLDPTLVRHLAACITVQGGCDVEAAEEIGAEEAQAFGFHMPQEPAYVADVLADLLSGPDGDRLEPIGPVVIGDAFVRNEFSRHDIETRAAIADRARNRFALSR